VRGEVIGRSLLLGLLLAGAGFTGIATAAEPCAECLTAGASSVTVRVPTGTPLAGYGGMKRRLLFPDLFGRYAKNKEINSENFTVYIFWDRIATPSEPP